MIVYHYLTRIKKNLTLGVRQTRGEYEASSANNIIILSNF